MMSEHDKRDKIDASDAGDCEFPSPTTDTLPGGATVLSESDTAENRHNLNRFYHEGGTWFVDDRSSGSGIGVAVGATAPVAFGAGRCPRRPPEKKACPA